MTILNYNIIPFKNKKLISIEEISKLSPFIKLDKINDDYQAFVGDSNCTIAFNKNKINIIERSINQYSIVASEDFSKSNYKWSKWVKEVYDPSANNKNSVAKIIVKKSHGCYKLKWNYMGDDYKIYFGRGVKYYFYEKYGFINYYRSIYFIIFKIKRIIKNLIYNI